MKCPNCRAWTEVIESRLREDNTRYRRYQCANGHRFTTYEHHHHKEQKHGNTKRA